jgi:hypothetical protein
MSRNTSRRPDADQEQSFPVGLVVRLFAYLVAGHLFAAFLNLLFTVGDG